MGDHTRLHCCVDRIRQIASLDARYGHRPAPERVSELIGRDCIQADDAAQPSVCAQPYLHRHLPPPSTFSTLMIDEVPNGGAPASELVPESVVSNVTANSRRGLVARMARPMRRAALPVQVGHCGSAGS